MKFSLGVNSKFHSLLPGWARPWFNHIKCVSAKSCVKLDKSNVRAKHVILKSVEVFFKGKVQSAHKNTLINRVKSGILIV